MDWVFHHIPTIDTKAGTNEEYTEGDGRGTTHGEEKEDNKETAGHGVSPDLSDETQGLSITPSPRVSCRGSKERSKLSWTKSFPPYCQHMGGLWDESENETWPSPEDGGQHLELQTAHRAHARAREKRRTGHREGFRALEQGAPDASRRVDTGRMARRTRDEMRAKWRSTRAVSFDHTEGVCDGTEIRGREETGSRGGETTLGEKEDNQQQSTKDGDCGRFKEALWPTRERSASGNAQMEEDRGEDGGGKTTEVEEGRDGIGWRARSEKDKTREEAPSDECQPHPILSRILRTSSASSTSSSFNLSSAESDEVFSEGEDTASRRKTLRKCCSWKTFRNMMHWSLRRHSSWIQLAGHQGHLHLSEGGEVLKLFTEGEAKCLGLLMLDPLRPFVPQYHGLLTRGEECFIRLEDLLSGLRKPIIMDCKMGIRTYQEEEVVKARTQPTLRGDMYHRMVKADPAALTAEEHEQKGVTKWRYLRWRDRTSSTSTLGFRIEGILTENGGVQRDFRKIATLAQVTEALLYFTKSQPNVLKAYHYRLQALCGVLKRSPFFGTHEVIGSSLLFVHDNSGKANVWMIDFGKTTQVPDTRQIHHDVQWAEGNWEDGFLIGMASLTSSLGHAITLASQQHQDNSSPDGDTKLG